MKTTREFFLCERVAQTSFASSFRGWGSNGNITHIGTAQEYFVGVTSTFSQILLRNDTACDDTEQCGRLSKAFVYVIKTRAENDAIIKFPLHDQHEELLMRSTYLMMLLLIIPS